MTLIVIDTSVFVHRLYETGAVSISGRILDDVYANLAQSAKRLGITADTTKAKLETILYDRAISAHVGHLLALNWLGDLKPEHAQVVFVGDWKYNMSRGYWRADYMKLPHIAVQFPVVKARGESAPVFKARQELHAKVCQQVSAGVTSPTLESHVLAPVYKGGRKHPEYGYTKLRDKVYNAIRKAGLPLLMTRGYEADDQAALLVKLNQEYRQDIILATVDSDWLGLVGDRVTWYCMCGYSPRVRANVEHINDWLTRVKKQEPIECPADIWARKVITGDKSDNLPKGTPVELFDLLNPPEQYKLWNQPEALQAASRVFNDLPTPPRDEKPYSDFLRGLALAPSLSA